MLAYGTVTPSSERAISEASDELRVAVTFPTATGIPGLTKFEAPLSTATVSRFLPDPVNVDRAIHELSKLGFRLTKRGRLSASMRVSRRDYEATFGTRLAKFEPDPKQGYSLRSFLFPPEGAPWKPSPGLETLIDDAYIQWPHIYMAAKGRTPRSSASSRSGKKRTPRAGGKGPSVKPPHVKYFHLAMPKDVPRLLRAKEVHEAGVTGKGVRVVMVDSGFAHRSHPFFAAHRFTSTVDLAPHAVGDRTDPNGHGTGESTNVFAVAPGATFIGVKVDNDVSPSDGASMLEGFQAAMEHRPHVITISMGYDLRGARGQLSLLPNSLAALEAEVQSAVAAGVVVIFSAGNGHFSFPGMMPDVISAGGVYVDRAGRMQASDYASAFQSKIYSRRHVPDFCGLVGLLPHASYIMLPIPPGCEIDHDEANPNDGEPGDETRPDDGWGVFSGTSAAAPQLAGVCALLLEKNPRLTPSDIKAVLRRTARDVAVGHANAASSDDMRTPLQASAGDDGATGAGLVDALAAFQQV